MLINIKYFVLCMITISYWHEQGISWGQQLNKLYSMHYEKERPLRASPSSDKFLMWYCAEVQIFWHCPNFRVSDFLNLSATLRNCRRLWLGGKCYEIKFRNLTYLVVWSWSIATHPIPYLIVIFLRWHILRPENLTLKSVPRHSSINYAVCRITQCL